MRPREAAAIALLALLGAGTLRAQGPWVTTIKQTGNPLSIGSCATAWIIVIDPATKGTPRNEAGHYVQSVADFDISIESAGYAAAVGKYDAANIWSACACQSATVGQQGTIKFTYPAKALPEKLRVPGVAFTAQAPFTMSAAQTKYNPAGCATLATMVNPTSPVSSGKTLSAPSVAPTTTNTRPPVISSLSAAAPTGVAVTGTPLVARLTWNAMPNAVRYIVWRFDGTGVSIERTPANYTATQFVDTLPDPRPTYKYTIEARYANATSAQAPAVTFVSPPQINPSGFVARDMGEGGVAFEWQAVPGAARYRLDGPGLPNAGFLIDGTIASHQSMPAGTSSWRLVALYPGNYADYPGASIASTVVRILPPHSLPWLTHRNGAGLISQVQTPAHQELNDDPGGHPVGNLSGDLLPIYTALYARWLGMTFSWSGGCLDDDYRRTADTTNFCAEGLAFRSDGPAGPQCASNEVVVGGCNRIGLKLWLDINSLLWDEAPQAANEAVYGNSGDLGVGRRAFCEQKLRGPPYAIGVYTICYATAHGARPGEPGFNDLQTITHPGEGVGSDFILSMVITKDASGTVFLVLGSQSGKATLLPSVNLDTEGPKLVPFTCLSCHGGTYNPTTRKVDGASFLPLNPGLLAFASPEDQAGQEEKIRTINAMIVNSDPKSAVATYLRGLYGNNVAVPGTRATPDYVPQGWAPQAGFYRQVVRPYCATCHLAAPSDWNFASWSNFQSNATLIKIAVCNAHTMPHSELQYKAFWTKNTGAVYLPGLLATTIGFPSCP
jgi:hypothetical protein